MYLPGILKNGLASADYSFMVKERSRSMIHRNKLSKFILTVALVIALVLSVQSAFALRAPGRTRGFALESPNSPAVTCLTHPDSSIFYSNNNPSFSWSYAGEFEIKGYSYAFDQVEGGEPDSSVYENITEKSFTGVTDGTWYFHVKAIDINDIVSGTAHYAVKIDTASPTGSVLINGGAEKATELDAALSFDATDSLSGVIEMRFALSPEELLLQPFKPYSSSDTITLMEPNGLKTVYAQFKDGAGNLSEVVYDDINLAIDHTPPTIPAITSSTHPNSNEYFSNNDPAFSFIATDEESGVAGYSYVFDQADSTVPDTLINDSTGSASFSDIADGSWYLHVRAVDNKSNWSETAHYGIKIDVTAPEGSVIINNGDEWTDNNIVNLSFSSTDASSGVTQMRFAETEGELSGKEYQAYASSASMTLSDIDGLKNVYAQFKDGAGNESAVVSDSITLQPTPYEGTPKLSIGVNGKWFNPGDAVTISGKLTDADGKGLARYPILIKVRGKIVASVRSEQGGVYTFTDHPQKTTPYKAVFIDKNGKVINTRAVVAHVKKAKKVKKIKVKKASSHTKTAKTKKAKAPAPKPKKKESKPQVTMPDNKAPTEPAPKEHGKGKGKGKK